MMNSHEGLDKLVQQPYARNISDSSEASSHLSYLSAPTFTTPRSLMEYRQIESESTDDEDLATPKAQVQFFGQIEQNESQRLPGPITMPFSNPRLGQLRLDPLEDVGGYSRRRSAIAPPMYDTNQAPLQLPPPQHPLAVRMRHKYCKSPPWFPPTSSMAYWMNRPGPWNPILRFLLVFRHDSQYATPTRSPKLDEGRSRVMLHPPPATIEEIMPPRIDVPVKYFLILPGSQYYVQQVIGILKTKEEADDLACILSRSTLYAENQQSQFTVGPRASCTLSTSSTETSPLPALICQLSGQPEPDPIGSLSSSMSSISVDPEGEPDELELLEKEEEDLVRAAYLLMINELAVEVFGMTAREDIEFHVQELIRQEAKWAWDMVGWRGEINMPRVE